MDAEEKGKITQNLTYLKERLGELDHIIDKFIERDVFRLEHRAQIEGISKPTPHRQFNEFIKLLVSSPSKAAYDVFVETLREEGYDNIAQKLQKTSVKESHGRHLSARTQRSLSKASKAPSPTEITISEEHGAAAASSEPVNPKSGCSDCADTVKMMLESFTRQQRCLIANIEQQRREDISAFEKRRMEDQNQTREQMMQLWGQLKAEKQEMVRENDMKISKLQSQINEFQRGSAEFNFLKEKYEHLREKQQIMREKGEERRTRLLEMTQERETLKKDNKKLERELEDTRIKLQNSEDTNRNLEDDQRRRDENCEELESKIRELEREMAQKDRENKNLETKVQKQYGKIQNILEQQKVVNMADDQEYVRTVEQQNRKLDDIYGMMQTMSVEKYQTQQFKGGLSSKRFQGIMPNGTSFGHRINQNKKN